MDWSRVDKSIFQRVEAYRPEQYLPDRDENGKRVRRQQEDIDQDMREHQHLKSGVGKHEAHALIKNIAVSMKYQGLKTTLGPTARKWIDDHGGEITETELERLARLMLASEVDGPSLKVSKFPKADEHFWDQFGERFGRYVVVVTKWGGKVVVNMKHDCGETLYWEMYSFQRRIWWIQNDGFQRFPDTKSTRVDFSKWFIKRCGADGWLHLLTEVYGFVVENPSEPDGVSGL